MNTIVITETYSEVQERQSKTDKKQPHKKKTQWLPYRQDGTRAPSAPRTIKSRRRSDTVLMVPES